MLPVDRTRECEHLTLVTCPRCGKTPDQRQPQPKRTPR